MSLSYWRAMSRCPQTGTRKRNALRDIRFLCSLVGGPQTVSKDTVWPVPKPQVFGLRPKTNRHFAGATPFRADEKNTPYIAAIIFLKPIVLSARFILKAKKASDNSPSAFGIVFIKRYATPIFRFTVPKGCSTILFR